MNQQVKNLQQSSLLSGGNLDYVEGLFEAWIAKPSSVPEEWQRYFNGLPGVNGKRAGDVSHASIINQLRGPTPKRGASYGPAPVDGKQVSLEHEAKQVSVVQMISSYRVRGHQHSQLDPLGLMHRDTVADLTPEFHNLSTADNNTVFSTHPLHIPQKAAKLGDLVPMLEDIYCSSIGYDTWPSTACRRNSGSRNASSRVVASRNSRKKTVCTSSSASAPRKVSKASRLKVSRYEAFWP